MQEPFLCLLLNICNTVWQSNNKVNNWLRKVLMMRLSYFS